jgi:hypothetical protein
MHAEPRPTTLNTIRDFLAAQGSDTPAWSPAERAIDGLLELLRQRKEDPEFWTALEGLVTNLQDSRVAPELVEGSELLDGATLGQLLKELRAALPSDEAPATARGWASGLGAIQALAAFVLLGTAVGCPPVRGPATPATCSDVEQLGLSEEDGQVYCDLLELVSGADIEDYEQTLLRDCLQEMSSTRRQQLLDSFEGLSEEELADELIWLAESDECEDLAGDDDDFGDH